MIGWVVFWFLSVLQRLSDGLVFYLCWLGVLWVVEKELVDGGVGAEGFDGGAFFLEGVDGFFEGEVLEMAVKVDEEVVFPSFAFAGAGFDFSEVKLMFSEGFKGAVGAF